MTLPCKTGVDPLLRVGWTIWKGAFVMTIREWAMDYCLQRGMPPTSAKAVLERWVNLETNNEEMGCPWEWDTTDDYSVFLLDVLSICIDFAVVAWTEQNCPQAWYQPMFDRTAEYL